MDGRRIGLALGWVTAGLALVASAAGLFWPADFSADAAAISVRGETVELWGRGLYRFESIFFAAGFRGQDLVTLLLAAPALAFVSWRVTREASVSWLLWRVVLLTYCLYVYATMALGAFYNELFLLYVGTFSAALFAFALAIVELARTIDLRWPDSAASMPRKTASLLLLLSGLFTGLVWAQPLVASLAFGTVPPLLGHATTKVTEALDLAIIVPSCFVGSVLVWQGNKLGYLFAVPLLGLIAMLFPTIAASALSQLAAGIEFSLPEILGPIGSFMVFGALGSIVLWRSARALTPNNEPYEHEMGLAR
jgi:hypothetical protein